MMRNNLLPGFIFILLILAGCRKESTPDKEEPVVKTIIPLRVANMLQSNMVIQRDQPFLLWGEATPGQKINIAVSWNSSPFSAVADNQKHWEVGIPASSVNAVPQTITCTATGESDVILKNILIGDVWLCSGQSNMVMQVDALPPFTGVLNYPDEIASANYPNIRALTVIADDKDKPLTEFTVPANWVSCSPQSAGNLSAVAYFFARKVHNNLNIPIGIIVSAINGSWCESWMNKEALQEPGITSYATANNATHLYDGMISPLTKLKLKGVLWYQGENNQQIYPVSDYTKLNAGLIKGWRGMFGQPELPFYLVQLTPFADDYNYTNPAGGDQTLNWLAFFREAQANVLNAVPNTGMAVTMDVGEAANHHPRDKKPVGERLALLALKNTYGQNIICNGPKYTYYTTSNRVATINFAAGTADGLTTLNNQPINQVFFAAGTDRIFRKASTQIIGNTIIVTASADTPLPVLAIRYAFTNSAITNIQNGAGLPMEPFRTDAWD